MFPVTVTRSFK